jgi:hypothetical protein
MIDLAKWKPEITYCPECGTALGPEPDTAPEDGLGDYCPKCEVTIVVLPGASPIGN